MEYKLNGTLELEEIVEMDTVNDIEMEEDTAAPQLNHKFVVPANTHNDAKQILMSKQQQHFNAQTIHKTTINSLQFQQDNKKDILQKIRNQIFERKRQRQMAASMQRIGGVWRPW